MPAIENKQVRCEECGAVLKGGTSALGCLNCLLLGSPNEPNPAARRFQHYEICSRDGGATLDELGRGAMGITYRAQDLNLFSEVALKVISSRYSGNDEARARFRREARAAAQLRHPNVAAVFHFGETTGGRCFYAMELIEGETVEARLRRTGPFSPIVALEVATQVGRALMVAEAHGLIHRDLKPSNLMIMADDPVEPDTLVTKVIDFGLAKAAAITLMRPGQGTRSFSGTPDFASPEQLNSDEMLIDIRSDIYSLGTILWYLLCGQTPFPGRTPGEVRDHRLPWEQLRPAHVPGPVTELLSSLLALDPVERPQTARELLIALQRCQQIISNPSFSD